MCRAAHPAAGVSQRDAAGGRQPATRHSEAHVLGCRRRRRVSRTPDRPHARVATLARSFRRTLRSDHSHRSRGISRRHRSRRRGTRNRSRPYHRSTPGHHRGRMPVVGPTSTGPSTSPKTRLSEATGQRHAPLARGLLVPPIPHGRRIVLFVFGLETALHDTSTSLALVPAFGLVGGIALYLLAHYRAPNAYRRGPRTWTTDRLARAACGASRGDPRGGRRCARHRRRRLRRAHHLRGQPTPRRSCTHPRATGTLSGPQHVPTAARRQLTRIQVWVPGGRGRDGSG